MKYYWTAMSESAVVPTEIHDCDETPLDPKWWDGEFYIKLNDLIALLHEWADGWWQTYTTPHEAFEALICELERDQRNLRGEDSDE